MHYALYAVEWFKIEECIYKPIDKILKALQQITNYDRSKSPPDAFIYL